MTAAQIIADWKRRLIALADSPEYVYRDTPPELIEKEYGRLTTFSGYDEEEVASVEAKLGGRFSEVFRQYLLEMAKNPGELFRGSDLATLNELEVHRVRAEELLAETDSNLRLPANAAVFLIHQGYLIVYVLAAGGFDAPPMQWIEQQQEPSLAATGFAQLVEAELELMESNNREFREQGGYYKTLSADGRSFLDFPTLASDERPLDSERD